MVLEALALTVFAIAVGVQGISDDAGQTIAEVVTLLAIAALGGALAAAISRGNALAKTPALLWHLFVLLTGLWLVQAGPALAGVVLALVGVVGLVLTWGLPNAEL